MNPILDGKDQEQRLVGLHEEGDQHVRLYTRTDTDDVISRRERIYPFLFATHEAQTLLKKDFAAVKCVKLKGKDENEDAFHWLFVFDSIQEWRDARKHLKRKLNHRSFYTIPQIATQYLMQTGKTLFKGMTRDDVHRMRIDIETITEHSFPNAERDEDEVIIISMSDNRGWEKVLHQSDTATERDILEELVVWVHRRNPDILELHNGFGFDLPYLKKRARMRGVNLALGRDNQEASCWPSKKDFADRTFEFQQFQYAGRAVIDTMFLAIDWDVYARALPGYGLKVIAKFFGKAAPNRTYVDGNDIPKMWKEDPERLIRYALDDVIETGGIADVLMNATFALTHMVPMDFQRVSTAGKSAIIESLFVRHYLTHRQALPRPMAGSMKVGGYTELFQRGVFADLNYADVESLYPSIMLFYDIQPKGDHLKIFPKLLRLLTDLRFEAKNKMKALRKQANTTGTQLEEFEKALKDLLNPNTTIHPRIVEAEEEAIRETIKELRDEKAKLESEAEVLDAQQSAYKILINSFYGMLGHATSLFNDFYEADRVTMTGQMLVKRLIGLIDLHGGDVVLADTDGVLYRLPRENMTDDEVDEFVKMISDKMPEGITVGNDGRFDKALAYMKKNYVLKGKDGKIKFKGVSFKGRNLEAFGRKYIKDVCIALLDEDVERVKQIHDTTRNRLFNRQMDITEIKSRVSLKKNLHEYQRDLENPNNNRQAGYELAIRANETEGRNYGAGDILHYFVGNPTKSKSRVKVFEDAYFDHEWKRGAEHIGFYMDRLKTFSEKFEGFFKPEDFTRLFDMDVENVNQVSMFDVQEEPISNIQILNTRVNELPS